MRSLIVTEVPISPEESEALLGSFMSYTEALAVAVEAYRQPNPAEFFERTVMVVLVNEGRREKVRQLWKILLPWLRRTYKVYPPLYKSTVGIIWDGPHDLELMIHQD